jgi:uncharacterized protein
MATTAHNSHSGEFSISIHDLRRQPGEMMPIAKTFPSTERIGIDVIAIESESEISISGKVESVSTGVLVSCQIESIASGECVRCLDPITLPIRAVIQELYYYSLPSDLDEDEDEPLLISEERVDLLPPIRDAVILDLPLTPHCSEECLGLCPECGEKLAPDNPASHNHASVDPRWAKLRDLPKLGE